MVGAHDIDAFVDHLQQVIPQSGEDGGPVFAPYAPDQPPSYEKMRKGRLAGWEISVGMPGWRRAWAAFSGARVVGDIELDGGAIHADLHRATLGMAIQREYRGQGLGSRLLDTVIGWAREQELEYIDLGDSPVGTGDLLDSSALSAGGNSIYVNLEDPNNQIVTLRDANCSL